MISMIPVFRRTYPVFLVWVVAVWADRNAPAQTVVFPTTVINRSITAQGDIIRANADAFREIQAGNVLYAQARQQLATAVSMELDNYIKYAETYYNRRILREEKKMELLDLREELYDKKGEIWDRQRQRLINRLMSDREQARSAIPSGTALNKILYALAETPVAFDAPMGAMTQSQVDQRLQFEAATLDAIRIQSPGKQRSTVQLTRATGIDLSWWPEHLRQAEFDVTRTELERAIESVNAIAAGGNVIDRDSISDLKLAIAAMSQAYNRAYPPSVKRNLPTEELQQFLRTDDFLTRLHSDLQKIRDTQRCDPLGSADPFDIDAHGRNALTLARWMLQNGIRFDAAQPGDEAQYYTMFTKMADLLTLVTN